MNMGWLYELEKYTIVVAALIMAYAEFAQYFRHRKSWIKFALGLMAMYWVAYYVFSILRGVFDWQFFDHQVFVRSGILLTIALVGANAFMTLRVLDRLDR
jgi:membrane protein YdbS with pleckstrin-like domain